MEKKEFNPSVAMFPTRDGRFNRVFVNAAVYDVLQKATVGTSILLTALTDEQRDAIEAKGKTAPSYRLVIMPESTLPAKGAKKAPTKKTTKEEDL